MTNEQKTKRLMQEARALDIPAASADAALEFMADFLPKITEYENDIRILLFGMACYDAGRREAQ